MVASSCDRHGCFVHPAAYSVLRGQWTKLATLAFAAAAGVLALSKHRWASNSDMGAQTSPTYAADPSVNHSTGLNRRAQDYRLLARFRDGITNSFRSKDFAKACRDLNLKHSHTRPYRPQTNGKAERFIQSALREWAHSASYTHSSYGFRCSISAKSGGCTPSSARRLI